MSLFGRYQGSKTRLLEKVDEVRGLLGEQLKKFKCFSVTISFSENEPSLAPTSSSRPSNSPSNRPSNRPSSRPSDDPPSGGINIIINIP